MYDPIPPPEERCAMCLGPKRGEVPCADIGPCVKRTGKLDPLVFIERMYSRLNAFRATVGKKPLEVRHYLINPEPKR